MAGEFRRVLKDGGRRLAGRDSRARVDLIELRGAGRDRVAPNRRGIPPAILRWSVSVESQLRPISTRQLTLGDVLHSILSAVGGSKPAGATASDV